jgi:hypothetical protein
LSSEDFYAYSRACKNGHLNVAYWLQELAEQRDINYERRMRRIDHEIFKEVCQNGHIDVAKWLYSKHHNFDISYDKDFPFRYSCRNNHIDLAVWLFCLSDRYVLHVKDNKITYFWCYEYAEEN